MSGIQQMLLSGGSLVVSPLPGGLAQHVVIRPASAIAAWRFNQNGTAERRAGAVYTVDHKWHNAGGNTTMYIKAHLNSGTAPTGSLDTWLSFAASNREWTHSTTSTTQQCTLTFYISTAGTDATIISSSAAGGYSIYAESSL